ncbi:Protein suppressor of sable [Clarias magur]|uniref:Protein suppressor of sable n=1 Tax=Clarias magur TaxID=1594786 RepID=A0A8J4U671_CLAMG|nr:Protein suppressor of sable [Clarias magur]
MFGRLYLSEGYNSGDHNLQPTPQCPNLPSPTLIPRTHLENVGMNTDPCHVMDQLIQHLTHMQASPQEFVQDFKPVTQEVGQMEKTENHRHSPSYNKAQLTYHALTADKAETPKGALVA